MRTRQRSRSLGVGAQMGLEGADAAAVGARAAGGSIRRGDQDGDGGGRHDIDAARVTGREAETWRAR
jgi:hypothetical protein